MRGWKKWNIFEGISLFLRKPDRSVLRIPEGDFHLSEFLDPFAHLKTGNHAVSLWCWNETIAVCDSR